VVAGGLAWWWTGFLPVAFFAAMLAAILGLGRSGGVWPTGGVSGGSFGRGGFGGGGFSGGGGGFGGGGASGGW
jgi:uncharacterized protein